MNSHQDEHGSEDRDAREQPDGQRAPEQPPAEGAEQASAPVDGGWIPLPDNLDPNTTVMVPRRDGSGRHAGPVSDAQPTADSAEPGEADQPPPEVRYAPPPGYDSAPRPQPPAPPAPQSPAPPLPYGRPHESPPAAHPGLPVPQMPPQYGQPFQQHQETGGYPQVPQQTAHSVLPEPYQQPQYPPPHTGGYPQQPPPGYPQQAPPVPHTPQQGNGAAMGYNAAVELSSDRLIRSAPPVAKSGWRRTVRQATFGLVKLKPGREELERLARMERVRIPVVGCHNIAVISLKGGVGKTTTTTCLGATLAAHRGDRIIALDANPDAGTLGRRVRRETNATVRDLLTALPNVHSYTDIRAFTSQSHSRLEVLSNDVNPEVSTAFTREDYRKVVELLGKQYSIVLTDSGTGLLHSAMKGALDVADSLIVVSSASVDGAHSASMTYDWLTAHGYSDLVSRAVTVIGAVRPTESVDQEQLVAHFKARSRAVVTVPYDEHLATGAEIDLERLRPRTREAYLELAAVVAEEFGITHNPYAPRPVQ